MSKMTKPTETTKPIAIKGNQINIFDLIDDEPAAQVVTAPVATEPVAKSYSVTVAYTIKRATDSEKPMEVIALMNAIGKAKKDAFYYELITGECVKYFDFDKKFDTKEELDDYIFKNEELILINLRNVFNIGTFYVTSAHGKALDNKGDVVYKFSLHVIVRDGYKYSCGKDILDMYEDKVNDALELNDIKMDASPYKPINSKQLLRTIYSIKETDKDCYRPFRPIDMQGDKIKVPASETHLYFASIVCDAKLKPKPVPVKLVKPVKSASDTDSIASTDLPAPTLEQIRQVLALLKRDRFGVYDPWYKLLWGVARWCEDTGNDEDDIIEMLDEFSRECDNYKEGDVKEKYHQYRAKSNKAVTIATVLHWAKEDNLAEFRKIFNLKKSPEEIAELADEARKLHKSFDAADPFTFAAYEKKFGNGKIWDSKEELMLELQKDTHRVLARSSDGKGAYIKKSTRTNLFDLISLSDDKVVNFPIQYKECITKTKGGKLSKVEYVEEKIHEIISVDKRLGIIPIFESIVCDPDHVGHTETEFNTWRGFKAELLPEYDINKIQPMLDLIKEVWADNNEASFNYIMDRFRADVQFPGMPSGAIIVVSGKQGCGKNTFTNFYRKYVIGDYLTEETNGITALMSGFNKFIMNKKLIVLNELADHGKQWINDFNKLKTLITEETIQITIKGVDTFKMRSFATFIAFTNEAYNVPVEIGDRRYATFRAGNGWLNDKAKFKQLRKDCYNQDVGNHFYTYLMTSKKMDSVQDIRGSNIPDTEFRLDLIKLTMPTHIKFLIEIKEWLNAAPEQPAADEDDFTPTYQNDDNIGGVIVRGRYEYSAGELYKAYKAWGVENREWVEVSATKFGLLVKDRIAKTRTRTGTTYDITTITEDQLQ